MDFHKSTVVNYIERSVRVTESLTGQADAILSAAQAMTDALRRGNKVLTCGNGGSASDAQHLAAELLGKFYHIRRMLPAIALTTNTSILTAIGNDFSFDEVFVRQVRGLMQPGDILVGISTSGESRNVLLAVHEAKRLGAITIGLSGAGGKLKQVVDHAIAVPSNETPLIQEAHETAIHIICALVESAFYPNETARAVFVDRDGTINHDVPYCPSPDKFEMYADVPQGLKLLQDAGLKLVVVTNQSGLARGYFTREALEAIHERMRHELQSHGVVLDAVLYCPHHPDDGCPCRKPNVGLFKTASEEHRFDLARSFVIGDAQSDVEAARTIGAKVVLVKRTPENKAKGADFTAKDMNDASRWILQSLESER
jgi:D-sedoheptulose 7-phosphate isomerase